ncbi:MAG: hypothetical protein RXQ74_03935 [Caldivirga sp.]
MWGFHEAKLSSESVKARELYVARLFEEVKKLCQVP